MGKQILNQTVVAENTASSWAAAILACGVDP